MKQRGRGAHAREKCLAVTAGSTGVRIFERTASGALCARTTAPTARPGNTSRTTMHASRAYRWGEDGIAGRIRFRTAGVPVARFVERRGSHPEGGACFGLTNSEGNHGEDVQRAIFYLDATPSHSYLKMLYKYPQRAPIRTRSWWPRMRGRRHRRGPEYELLDTGIFAEHRYFDVFVEYAQGEPRRPVDAKSPRGTAGPKAACLHVIPQLVAAQYVGGWEPGTIKPLLRAVGDTAIGIEPATLGMSFLYVDGKRGAALHRKTNRTPNGFWGIGGGGYSSRTVSTSASWGPGKARVNPAKTGTKSRCVAARDDSVRRTLPAAAAPFRAGHRRAPVPRFRPMPVGAAHRGR